MKALILIFLCATAHAQYTVTPTTPVVGSLLGSADAAFIAGGQTLQGGWGDIFAFNGTLSVGEIGYLGFLFAAAWLNGTDQPATNLGYTAADAVDFMGCITVQDGLYSACPAPQFYLLTPTASVTTAAVAPELDAGSMVAMLTLLIGSLCVLRGRQPS